MKKYKLIKNYPGSPLINHIAEVKRPDGFYMYNQEHFKPDLYPEFWEEVIEKDYEILSYLYKPNGSIVPSSNFVINIIENEKSIYKIHSVKRLSDGEIFTIGDKVDDLKYKSNNVILEQIQLIDNYIKFQVSTGISANWNEFNKSEQPLFTTEDGVNIFEGNKSFGVTTYWNIISYDGNKYGVKGNVFFNNKWFSTKEKAKEYMLMNKPCLSINDFKKYLQKDSLGDIFIIRKKEIEKLVKSKL